MDPNYTEDVDNEDFKSFAEKERRVSKYCLDSSKIIPQKFAMFKTPHNTQTLHQNSSLNRDQSQNETPNNGSKKHLSNAN